MFHIVNRYASAILAALSLTLLIAPAIVHWLFQIDSGAATDIMSRRAAMLFAGLATITFLARDTDSTEVQRVVSAGITVTMAGLAVLGFVEWIRGAVGVGIFLAIAVELVFTALYFRLWQDA